LYYSAINAHPTYNTYVCSLVGAGMVDGGFGWEIILELLSFTLSMTLVRQASSSSTFKKLSTPSNSDPIGWQPALHKNRCHFHPKSTQTHIRRVFPINCIPVSTGQRFIFTLMFYDVWDYTERKGQGKFPMLFCDSRRFFEIEYFLDISRRIFKIILE